MSAIDEIEANCRLFAPEPHYKEFVVNVNSNLRRHGKYKPEKKLGLGLRLTSGQNSVVAGEL